MACSLSAYTLRYRIRPLTATGRHAFASTTPPAREPHRGHEPIYRYFTVHACENVAELWMGKNKEKKETRVRCVMEIFEVLFSCCTRGPYG